MEDMKNLIQNREQIITDLRLLKEAKAEIERDVIKSLIRAEAHEYLSVNWSQLRREYVITR